VVTIRTWHIYIGLLAFFLATGSGCEKRSTPSVEPSSHVSGRLSPQGNATLLAIIATGNLSDLSRPDFLDHRTSVKNFYESVGHALVWTKGTQPTNQALALVNLFQNADKKGLNPEDYDGSRWAERVRQLRETRLQGSECDLVRFDLMITISALRYASDLHTGRVNPHQVHFGFTIERKKTDLAEFLRRNIVSAVDVKTSMAKLEPPFPVYWRAEKALETYQKLARQDDAELLPSTNKPIRPGDSYSGIARLARLLRLIGDLPLDATVSPNKMVYEAELVDAVRHFQQRHGLEPDGIIGHETLRQLNIPLVRRVEQLELALERWRWLPAELSGPLIVVNIPEFTLRAFDNQYKPVLTMKVVVGKAYGRRTPVFEREMTYVVFRPYWDVPRSIRRRELVPEIKKDPSYLVKHGYEVVDVHTRLATQNTGEEVLRQLGLGRLAIRQKPGPNNSLGLIKFLFPNENSVYMHATPAEELFAKSRRALSHGCIRLENAEQLAVWVLSSNSGWTRDRVRATMNGNKTVQVRLAEAIPVLIVYATAIVRQNGEVHFFDDVYGHDAVLRKVLAKGPPYSD